MTRTMVNCKLSIELQILYTECGRECPLPSGVLTQALLQHVDQCMQH